MKNKTSLSAGYITGAVNELLSENDKRSLKTACRFNVSSNADLDVGDIEQKHRQILSVLSNIISRGFPTYCSLYVEESLGELYGEELDFQNESDDEEYTFTIDEAHKDALKKSSTVVEPRCTTIQKSVEEFQGSVPAKKFYNSLPLHIQQFTQPERLFDDGIVLSENEGLFYRRQVDFAIETPTGAKWIVEVDGKQHQRISQQLIDKYRDEKLYESGWKVVRISTSDADYNSPALKKLRNDLDKDETLKIAKAILESPFWDSPADFSRLHMVHSPIAVGRTQLAICKAALSGNFDIYADRLRILCYERDVSYSLLAIEDFYKTLSDLYNLTGIQFNAPKIELDIILTDEFVANKKIFANKKFSYISDYQFITVDDLKENHYDLILDVSVLEKINLKAQIDFSYLLAETGIILSIRSEFNMKPVAKVEGDSPIIYSDIDERDLETFLNNLFRKKGFRDGQVKILERALSGNDTIGLLPTGSGKSLCYQLATILQPGISIIIEPLKALMVDQHRNLKNTLIEHCVYINSDIDTHARKQIEQRWARSEYQYIWVSPERLQIKEFRSYLQDLTRKMPVIYAVIDEAHCVSEWGHDFRTSYLMMSKTLRKYCQYEGNQPIFYGLTATASETVLKDIKLELVKNDNDNSVIKPRTFDRSELNFKIHRCSSSEKFDYFTKAIGEICSTFDVDSNELFEPAGSDTLSGLVFCPHVKSTDFSISKLSSKISAYYNFEEIEEINEPETPLCPDCEIEMVERQGQYGRFWGCSNYPRCTQTEEFSNGRIEYYDRMHMFSGSAVEEVDNSAWDEYKIKAQSEFIENKVPLMVSTKAFGMGIDKPNIRYTIHYSIPSSLEAYYQEAGRAGRGREVDKAVNVILFSDDSLEDARERLNIKKSAAEVRDMEDLPWDDQGDIHRMLFFQRLSFEGFAKELKAIREILNYDLHEPYTELKEGQSKEAIISDKGNNTEKALYRLSLIGLVHDYTIEFSHPRFYQVTIKKEPYEKYSQTLYHYIKRHGIPQQDSVDLRSYIDSEEEFFQYVKSRDYNHFITKCCTVLLEYIYATIEPQRRRALLNLVDALESGDPNHFRKSMLRYLSPDEEFNILFNVFPDEDTPDDWEKIFKKGDDEETIGKLLGIALRYLESYPSNPGLLFIAAGLRLSLHGENPKLALNDFEAAFTEIFQTKYKNEVVKFFKVLLAYLFKSIDLYPKSVNEIVMQCSEHLDSAEFDMWIYQNSTLAGPRSFAAKKLINVIGNKTEMLLEKLRI